MWNKETGSHLLMTKDTGTLTRKAPMIPCIITNLVYSIPLKNPIKQNKKHVSRQSMAYAPAANPIQSLSFFSKMI